MKFYGAPMPAPNPRRVRIFAAEKGIALDEVSIDLRAGEHKTPAHLARNSLGQVPVLELDDGTTISETLAICRYLEAVYPQPPLFGTTPTEMALVDMWVRRVENQLGEPTRLFWRHAHPATARLVDQHVAFGRSNQEVLRSAVRWFDRELADGRPFVAGDDYTIADIAALTIVDFARLIGMVDSLDGKAVTAWHERVSARPSSAA